MWISLPSADPARCPGASAGCPADLADSSPDAARCSAVVVDSPSAGGSSASCSGSSANRADSLARDPGLREPATPWMLGVLATELTCSTGRRRNSDTSVTTTGVTAALISVPAPHSRDARNDAVAEATLAMTSVWIEMPLRDGFSLFGGLATPLSNADQPPNPVKPGHPSELRSMGAQTTGFPTRQPPRKPGLVADAHPPPDAFQSQGSSAAAVYTGLKRSTLTATRGCNGRPDGLCSDRAASRVGACDLIRPEMKEASQSRPLRMSTPERSAPVPGRRRPPYSPDGRCRR